MTTGLPQRREPGACASSAGMMLSLAYADLTLFGINRNARGRAIRNHQGVACRVKHVMLSA